MFPPVAKRTYQVCNLTGDLLQALCEIINTTGVGQLLSSAYLNRQVFPQRT